MEGAISVQQKEAHAAYLKGRSGAKKQNYDCPLNVTTAAAVVGAVLFLIFCTIGVIVRISPMNVESSKEVPGKYEIHGREHGVNRFRFA